MAIVKYTGQRKLSNREEIDFERAIIELVRSCVSGIHFYSELEQAPESLAKSMIKTIVNTNRLTPHQLVLSRTRLDFVRTYCNLRTPAAQRSAANKLSDVITKLVRDKKVLRIAEIGITTHEVHGRGKLTLHIIVIAHH